MCRCLFYFDIGPLSVVGPCWNRYWFHDSSIEVYWKGKGFCL